MGDRLARSAGEVATRLFGPVFSLDAARIGRRRSTFLVRWLYLLVLTGILGLCYLQWWADNGSVGVSLHPQVLAQFAGEFFWVYAITQFLVVSALTPAFTAATITEEKERKTLDYLLTTDLTGREIVFGKLAVRIGALVTFLLVGVPILALLEFLGGIEPQHLLVAIGMTLATVLSLAAIGAATSVQMPRTRDAVVLAYILPVGYLIGSVAMLGFAKQSGLWGGDFSLSVGGVTITGVEIAEGVAAGNPFIAIRGLDRPGRPATAASTAIVAAWYVGFHLIVAVVGFAFAAFRVRACTQTAPVWVRPRGPFKAFLFTLFDRRTSARKHPPVGNDPVRWREIHVEPGSSGGVLRQLLTVAVLAAVILPFLWICMSSFPFWAFGLHVSPYSNDFEIFHGMVRVWVATVTGGLGMLMLLRASIRGATAVTGERERDTWVSLLATPLTPAAILRGKWAGCVWGQRRGMYLLGAVWAAGVLTGATNPIAVWLTGALFVVYLRTFAWLGLCCSITAQNSRTAIARAVTLALFMGGGFWIVLGFLIVATGGFQGFGALFFAGWTPAVILAGLPLLEFSSVNPHDPLRETIIIVACCGLAVGTLAWWFVEHLSSRWALIWFKREIHRTSGGPARTRPPEQGSDPRSWREMTPQVRLSG
jgi:ABC-type transport system involved in multi-copper enzyme maturation permease subunit